MRSVFSICLFITLQSLSQTPAMLEKKLDSLYKSYFREKEPGGAVLLVRDGTIIFRKAYGLADINSGQFITTGTLFNIGSISKTFVAYGILVLAREGKLSLDDPLEKYFPDFTEKKIAQKVKLVHLLTHSSGLPDSRRVKEEREFYLTAKDEENFAPLKQTRELQFEPGSRYRYSNPAFNGLALVIEQLTGMKWQQFIREKIFLPAGMVHSTITDGPHPSSGVAHGYIKNEKNQLEECDYGEEPTFAAAGNGGVWSSVDELWKYEEAIQEQSFLDKHWISLSRTIYSFPAWVDSTASRLGLSWFLNGEGGGKMIGHEGSQGGFISDYCWWPEHKLFYVLLCNIPRPIREIRGKMLDLLAAVEPNPR
jgi:CubicO group peptidase (beta-lactamase class C family)